MEKLTDYLLSFDPAESFQAWLKEAKKQDLNPEAFTLATASSDGTPSARVLLLKGHGPNATYRFFTHSSSPKGRDLKENPKGCMVFYWVKSERQVRISGVVKPLSREETYRYFSSRAHKSQLASYISDQSQVIESRKLLEKRFQKALEKYPEGEVPLPIHWQGYELVADEMEFFVYGEYRLNDRFLYSKNSKGLWEIMRLQP